MSEFDLIRRYFSHLGTAREDVVIDVGDDAAVVDVPVDHQLVLAVDTLVANVHFPLNTAPDAIGYKSLAVNVSDLAAMGAEPAWALLAITMPDSNVSWVESFCAGFHRLAQQVGMKCVGGDTTRGPLTISVTVAGTVPKGRALTRRKAMAGDAIYVTGTIGDAGLGLRIVQEQARVDSGDYFLNRLNYPRPRIEAGVCLRENATSAIDISDGLLADLGHILEQSNVGANILLDRIPLHRELANQLDALGGWEFPLSAGDDYELCFTVSPPMQATVEKKLADIGCPYMQIGHIASGKGLRVWSPSGEEWHFSRKGYNHFQ